MAVISKQQFWLTREMAISGEEAGPKAASGSAIAYNLAGIAVLVLLMAVGLAYLIDQASRTANTATVSRDDTDTVAQTIGGLELTIPKSWFRYGEQIKDGFVGQADLHFSLDLAENSQTLFDVTLMPRSRARASSALLDAVYLHQFAEGTVSGVAGLVGKPLLARDGYAGETVWYDPLTPNPFVAKCMAPVEPGSAEKCLRTIHLPSGLAAVISFDASALPYWQSFDAEMALWLEQIGAL